MSNLVLSFEESLQELRGLQNLAEPFLAYTYPLEGLHRQLIARRKNGASGSIEIPKDEPLRVKPSSDYASGKSKPQRLYEACISLQWQIKPIPDTDTFEVLDASTLVNIQRVEPGSDQKRPPEWRMEIGTETSPGAFFHVQIAGETDQEVEVPRLPFHVPTPATCVEFVLAELFQVEWPQRVQSVSAESWRLVQRNRLLQWIEWQADEVRGAGAAPWLALKRAKPEPDRFIPKG